MIEVSSEKARGFILDVQGLRTQKLCKSALSVARRIHSIQIDTMSVVSRSHNLIIYNRYPRYQERDVWKDLKKGKLFEYWSHSLCLLPIETYPFYVRKMEQVRRESKGYFQRFGEKMKDTIREIYEHIKKNGATSSSDFKGESLGWGGSIESRSMQYLHYTGQIMIAFRENFQKFYDLTERVLPTTTETTPMSDSELAQFTIQATLGSLGLGNYQDIRTYLGRWPAQFLWKNSRGKINDYLEELVGEGFLEQVSIEGVSEQYYILSKNVKQLMNDNIDVSGEPVKLLSPFDNIIRERHYPLNIWNFDYKLESYVPAIKRVYGYHVLPLLDGFNLVGRVDVKVHRNENRMNLISLYLENDFWKEKDGLERAVQGFKDFGKYHQVESITVENVSPKSAKRKIVKQLAC
ncbi:MAG: winged helix-turn-helix domain-containing protein [Candidatus Thorarchaeota archaeon]|nr:winged helix-turn-helix domain-containing protein [Candidatus Thorarchaeota archaeon]